MITIGIIGTFQNGKSTLINCMMGLRVAQTGGEGVSVTSTNTFYTFGNKEKVSLKSDNGEKTIEIGDFIENKKEFSETDSIRVELPIKILRNIQILDTPGFNANKHDSESADRALNVIDAAIVVLNNKGISDDECRIFSKLEKKGIPYILLMNCLMQQGPHTWNPLSEFNKSMKSELEAKIVNNNFHPFKVYDEIIFPVNLIWYWFSMGYWEEDTEYQRYLIEKNIRFYEEEGAIKYKSASNFRSFFDYVTSKQFILAIRFNTRLRVNLLIHTNALEVLPLSMYKNVVTCTEDIINQLEREKNKIRKKQKMETRQNSNETSTSFSSILSNVISVATSLNAYSESDVERIHSHREALSKEISFYKNIIGCLNK